MNTEASYRKAVSCLVLALLLFSLPIRISQTSARANAELGAGEFSTIDQYVHNEMQAASIPGLAYGMVKHGQVVHLGAFGVTGPDGQL